MSQPGGQGRELYNFNLLKEHVSLLSTGKDSVKNQAVRML